MRSGRSVTTKVLLAIVLSIIGAAQADERHISPKDRDDGHHRSIPARIAALEAAVSTLQNRLNVANNTISGLQTALAAETAARQAADTQLNSASALAQALAPYMSVDLNPISGLPGPHILVTGANVHVRNGLDTTKLTNALGNLIVGYNEGFFVGVGARTGSHNLVVGLEHAYTSYGGFVAGEANKIMAPGASVSGGAQNTASGAVASVSGGVENTASSLWASVSGGAANTASGEFASISGGRLNHASGPFASVSGGAVRTAPGTDDWGAGSLFQDF